MDKLLNIKNAKVVLEYLLKEFEKNQNLQNIENFDLMLRYFYHNEILQKQSKEWISKIENKEVLTEIINKEEFQEFYYAHPRSKYYQYYVNSLGIVLLIETATKEYYDCSSNAYNTWILPIGNDGCLDNVSFNNEKVPIYIGHLSIYELMKESKWLKTTVKEGYQIHHIVCNYDNDNKNDARDNRQDNMIAIPKDLHRHAELNKEDKNFAEQKYKQYLHLLQKNKNILV